MRPTTTIPPSFTLRPEPSLTVAEGERVVALQVAVAGEPEPQVEWLRDGRRVKPGEGTAWARFVVTRDKGRWFLVISDVKVAK